MARSFEPCVFQGYHCCPDARICCSLLSTHEKGSKGVALSRSLYIEISKMQGVCPASARLTLLQHQEYTKRFIKKWNLYWIWFMKIRWRNSSTLACEWRFIWPFFCQLRRSIIYVLYCFMQGSGHQRSLGNLSVVQVRSILVSYHDEHKFLVWNQCGPYCCHCVDLIQGFFFSPRNSLKHHDFHTQLALIPKGKKPGFFWAGVRLRNLIHFFETLRIQGQS